MKLRRVIFFLPIKAYLEEAGVDFSINVVVTDIDFEDVTEKVIQNLSLQDQKIQIGKASQ